METYFNNLFFTYFPYISIVVFLFGVITRIVFAPNTIQAKSTQFLGTDNLKISSNLFHIGILMVFFGHLGGLLTPERLYHLVMTTETKQILAVALGGTFGTAALLGLIQLIYRRLKNDNIRINSTPQDFLLLFLLLFEIVLGMISVFNTASAPVHEYASLGIWTRKVLTFQPDAGAVIIGLGWSYKLHIIVGLTIFIIFPYTKLMHMIALPIAYFFRSGYQLVRRGFFARNK